MYQLVLCPGLFSSAEIPTALVSTPRLSILKEERLMFYLVAGNLYLYSKWPSLIAARLKMNHLPILYHFCEGYRGVT